MPHKGACAGTVESCICFKEMCTWYQESILFTKGLRVEKTSYSLEISENSKVLTECAVIIYSFDQSCVFKNKTETKKKIKSGLRKESHKMRPP